MRDQFPMPYRNRGNLQGTFTLSGKSANGISTAMQFADLRINFDGLAGRIDGTIRGCWGGWFDRGEQCPRWGRLYYLKVLW